MLPTKLAELIQEIKAFVMEHQYLISTASSKIIVPNTNMELLKALSVNPELVYTISPRKFEQLCAYIYELSGHETKLTPRTRDDGADIIVWTPPPVFGNAFTTVVQTKKYGKQRKVGAAEIRDLVGTQMLFEAQKAQMITTSDYAKPAINTAKKTKIDLVRFYDLNDRIKAAISDHPTKTL
jgi:restriction system protein